MSRTLLAVCVSLVSIVSACRDRNTVSLPVSQPDITAPSIEKNSFADVVSKVSPAVVTIHAERVVRAPRQHPFMDDPSFRDFFGDRLPQQQQPREQIRRGLGSGVIVRADGYVVTNHHVIDGAEEIQVELTDRRSFEAQLIGSDPPSDLAVLKIDAKDLPNLALGNSDRVRVGDIVLAVGNPLGVGQTVTAGIISAKGRQTGLSDGSFEDFLQTDAPINQGNSGGALVSTNAELIGINSQILSPSGGNIGIGFAIPSNMARSVVEQLISGGKVRRGQLGIVVQAVTADIASSLGLKEARGLIASSIQAGSAAARAGIKQGDVILAINGQPVSEPNVLRNTVAATAPGTNVTLTIMRDGREQEVKVAVGEAAATGDGNNRGSQERNGDERGQLGVEVASLTPALRERAGIPDGVDGLIITGVDPSGPAAEAGVREGDVVEQANRKPLRAPADLSAAILEAADRPLLLLIHRQRVGSIYVTIRPKR